MKNKDRRLYDKAIKNCEKGKIDKALKICEEGIANNLKNAQLLNLKGLLLYEKGQLKEAVTVWKLNISINNNEEARIYVKGSENDRDKLDLYETATTYLKSGNVDKALDLYIKCKDSDFNCIKVNTKISICYQRKGYFYKAMEYIEKSLKVDSDCEEAKKIREDLYVRLKGEYNKGIISKDKLIAATAFIGIVAICAGAYSIRNKNLLNRNQEVAETDVESNNDITEANDVTTNNSEVSENKDTLKDAEDKVKFDNSTVNSLVENKDFNKLYDVLKTSDTTNLNDYDKELYYKAEQLMKTEGVKNFYQTGLDIYKEKRYTDSISNFDKAYKYCSDSYLKPHVIFYRGAAASNVNKKDITEAMYEEYSKEYPSGSYIEGVLYELALLNDKNANAEKAKKYARELTDKHPDSLYINDKIKKIAEG